MGGSGNETSGVIPVSGWEGCGDETSGVVPVSGWEGSGNEAGSWDSYNMQVGKHSACQQSGGESVVESHSVAYQRRRRNLAVMSVCKHRTPDHSHLSWTPGLEDHSSNCFKSHSPFRGFYSPHTGEDNIRCITDCVDELAV